MEAEQAGQLLAAERSRLQTALAQLTASDPAGPFDPADAAPELLETEIEAGLAERLREELDAVGRAEQRLAEGVYGVSIESGEAIPDARLRAIPWAERTAAEQARLDQLGR